MKKFLILHYGFEKPTPEDMEGWNKWFTSLADRKVEQSGFSGGKEITGSGTSDLPFASDSITGYTVIQAEDLDAATSIAKQCPIDLSTRVYEIRKH
ncbi:MAG: hypothetical protein O2971_12075 [Proteobacteria bacterium]|nr:hypothetical protein [Pseudomonadota bacterium]